MSHDEYFKWMHQNTDVPPIRFLTLGNAEWLLINNPEANRDIFHTACYACEKPSWLRRMIGEITGPSIFIMEGDVHKEHRKLLQGMILEYILGTLLLKNQQEAFLSRILRNTCLSSTGSSENSRRRSKPQWEQTQKVQLKVSNS